MSKKLLIVLALLGLPVAAFAQPVGPIGNTVSPSSGSVWTSNITQVDGTAIPDDEGAWLSGVVPVAAGTDGTNVYMLTTQLEGVAPGRSYVLVVGGVDGSSMSGAAEPWRVDSGGIGYVDLRKLGGATIVSDNTAYTGPLVAVAGNQDGTMNALDVTADGDLRVDGNGYYLPEDPVCIGEELDVAGSLRTFNLLTEPVGSCSDVIFCQVENTGAASLKLQFHETPGNEGIVLFPGDPPYETRRLVRDLTTLTVSSTSGDCAVGTGSTACGASKVKVTCYE